MNAKTVLLLVLGASTTAGCFEDSNDRNRSSDRISRNDRYDRRVDDRYGDRYGDRAEDRFRDRYGDDRYGSERYGKRIDQIPTSGGTLIRIGSVRASGKDDQNDLIEIRGNQRFAGLMFRVDRGSVDIDHIRVTFADDSAIEPKTSSHFRSGDETRIIDLPGADKNVKRVRVKYHSTGNQSSIIDVYGLVRN